MLVIVGHGPSIVGRRLGSWLDNQQVVRLKWAETHGADDWGSRTDYVCGSTPNFWLDRKSKKLPPLNAEYWWLPEETQPDRPGMRQGSHDWVEYWRKFRGERAFPKASTGLKAIFCAKEFLDPPEIGLIGFDMVLHPEHPTWKWFAPPGKYSYAHDADAERRCLFSLGVKIIDLGATDALQETP